MCKTACSLYFVIFIDQYQPHVTVFVVVAEWLRRWTRNPLGSPRAGSNPADYVKLPFFPPSFQRIEVFFSRFELATMIYTVFFY